MRFYTVHARRGVISDRDDTFVSLGDGFSWSAFFLGPLWLIWNQTWIALVIWLGFVGTAIYLTQMGHLPRAGSVAVIFLVCLATGLEAFSLRLSSQRKLGRDVVDVVPGANQIDALRYFVKRRVQHREPVVAGTAPVESQNSTAENRSVGLFPNFED